MQGTIRLLSRGGRIPACAFRTLRPLGIIGLIGVRVVLIALGPVFLRGRWSATVGGGVPGASGHGQSAPGHRHEKGGDHVGGPVPLARERGVPHRNGEQGSSPCRQRSPSPAGEQDESHCGRRRHGRMPRGEGVGVIHARGDVVVRPPQNPVLQGLGGQIRPHHRHDRPSRPAMTPTQQADDQDDGHQHPRSRHGDHREQGAGVTGDVVGTDLRPFQRGRLHHLAPAGEHEHEPQAEDHPRAGRREHRPAQTHALGRVMSARAERSHRQIVEADPGCVGAAPHSSGTTCATPIPRSSRRSDRRRPRSLALTGSAHGASSGQSAARTLRNVR